MVRFSILDMQPPYPHKSAMQLKFDRCMLTSWESSLPLWYVTLWFLVPEHDLDRFLVVAVAITVSDGSVEVGGLSLVCSSREIAIDDICEFSVETEFFLECVMSVVGVSTVSTVSTASFPILLIDCLSCGVS